ncbi:MAG: hypothetical protein ACK4Y6_06360 [Bacteroidota bacterium]
MNAAHVHLLVNHLPILFPLAGIMVLVIGFTTKSDSVKRASYILFILGACGAFIAMQSGERAEEIAESIGLSNYFIERHEESAEVFAIVSYILGSISILGFWAVTKQKSFATALGIVILSVAVIAMYFAKETGTTGGEIRHTEIRTDSTIPDKTADQTNEED